MLHRLMGRPILSQTDGVMGEHQNGLYLHQGGHPQGVAGVVGEGEEGPAVGNEAAVQRQTVQNGGHAELADPEEDVVAVAVQRCNGL